MLFRFLHLKNGSSNLNGTNIINSILYKQNGIRYYSNFNKMNIFDGDMKSIQKNNTVRLENYRDYDYIFREFGDRLSDRILDIKNMNKQVFKVLDFGSRYGTMNEFLDKKVFYNGAGGNGGEKMIEVTMVDTCKDLLYRDDSLDSSFENIQPNRVLIESLEHKLPFEDHSFDLIISNLALHWVNDLPGVVMDLKRLLKPDGVLLAGLFGEDTLNELKDSMYLAENEREGGFSPHVSPFTRVSDIGNILYKAKFSMPTIDTEKLQIKYTNAFALMHDLQGMGENNAVITRRNHTSKDTFLASAAIYKHLYADEDGNIPATFQVIYLIGWSPHASQPKPRERGSAKKRFSDLEGSESFQFQNENSSSPIPLKSNNNPSSTSIDTTQQLKDNYNNEEDEYTNINTSDFIIKRLDNFGNLQTVDQKNTNDNKNKEK